MQGDALQPDRNRTRVVKTLWPPKPGTLKHLKRFGQALVCVRYRQDARGLHRLTTVEVIIDEAPVKNRRSDNQLYSVKIGFHEPDLQAKAKAHGAKWDQQAKLWRMKGKAIKLLGLYTRVKENDHQ